MESYKKAVETFDKIYRFQHLVALAAWDSRTMMPPKGTQARGAAMGEAMKHIHHLTTCEETTALLDQAEAGKDALSPLEQANLREMRLHARLASVVPPAFVMRKVATTAVAGTAWEKCRKDNDFASFLPHFEKVVELGREEARLRSAATGEPLYEALFHLYEPGMPLALVDEIFNDVRSWLPELLRKVQAKQKEAVEQLIPLQTPLDVEKQAAMNKFFAGEVWGFDFEAGRIDPSAHPFTGMVKEDNRITTHAYTPDGFAKAIFATIHEVGHSKYETNMGPAGTRGQVVCTARSYGIHESQSRFAEVIVGHSSAFSEFLASKLVEYLGHQPAFDPKNVRTMLQEVKPGYIRIEADELCYTLHILIRYEIERALIEGKLEAADVPAAWNEKMKAYLGLETEGKDNLGCLQDVHWSKANFGYFPTYSLGSMFAAQLMATIKKELGEDTVDKCIRTGEMGPIFELQKKKIWEHGSFYETEELMRRATGETLNPKYFREHLERRYLHAQD